ncbi:putative enzyme related to lactoylglutathione lyase [Conyzicola lurida]|uniref:Putative enzyme related to lactoylglutathione lyase n=1 Tax=Conyzicola lurida TaxID=1172621 RepID=A0A841AQR4_9MICO|nr:VOC family protein [Conyzicola lurida]MBB5844624.1 putative enzyme related to lactoylglutathione lyase [Conyzicola lurida]
MLRGLTTVAYLAADLDAAKNWYTEVLGTEPYFDRTEYVEFRIGDYEHELGILDSRFLGDLSGSEAGGSDAVPAGPGGAIVYWHVDDAQVAYDRLIELGAQPFQPPRDFGEGFIGASVIDPFGNVLGVMYNPHYLAVLERRVG